MPLKCDIKIARNGPFLVEVANQEHPFKAMLISHSRGTCLIVWFLPLVGDGVEVLPRPVVECAAHLGEPALELAGEAAAAPAPRRGRGRLEDLSILEFIRRGGLLLLNLLHDLDRVLPEKVSNESETSLDKHLPGSKMK